LKLLLYVYCTYLFRLFHLGLVSVFRLEFVDVAQEGGTRSRETLYRYSEDRSKRTLLQATSSIVSCHFFMMATTTATPEVPLSVLLDFFRSATKALEECTIADPKTLSDLRMVILTQQKQCLEHIVDVYNDDKESPTSPLTVQIMQHALKDLPSKKEQQELDPTVQKAMDEMDDGARLSFTRLVLLSECLKEHADVIDQSLSLLKTSGSMQRSDILEFCGLCNAAIRLSNVQKHLQSGAPLFEDNNTLQEEGSSKIFFPQKRLEMIQRMFLKATGYDPDHGTAEIQRIFFSAHNGSSGNTDNTAEFSVDPELMEVFTNMASAMNVALTNATIQATHNTFFSDQDQGGVTRVVAVNYSEKIIDQATGQEVAASEDIVNSSSDAAPLTQTMDTEDKPKSPSQEQLEAQQRAELRVAREAATLQQEILGELLNMRDEERDAKLKLAKQEADKFIQQAMLIPPGPERVSFLRSVDSETQKLMAMHKLWGNMLAANGGKPPTMRYNRPAY
jgi:hypothetical protein